VARILIVDDEKCLRITLQAFLRGAGHDVMVAEDARLAIQLLEESPFFDVVVSDIGLPHMDGFELCETVRQFAPCVKTILMTGDPSGATAAKATRIGAERFLVKPISARKICKVVDEVTRTANPRDAQPCPSPRLHPSSESTASTDLAPRGSHT